MAEMIPIKEAAACWNITERRVATLCKDGKIVGAEKQGKRWMIPADTQKPVDQRIKTGAFRKTERATKRPLPIGVSNYCLASSEYYYIDKTMMIKDFIDERPMVTLFTRPRRFGKTLNMDMLRTFFEKSDEDTSVYFRDKKIWSCGQKYRDYQGKYPVIFLTFKDVKFDTWAETFAAIRDIFAKETRRHKELLTSGQCDEYSKKTYEKLAEGKVSEVELTAALLDLSAMLHQHYGIAPIIIIDEYDTPIQQGYQKDYYDKVIGYHIPENTPFVGANFNTTQAGIHADGMLKDEEIYSIFDTRKILKSPPRVGISRNSGAAGIAVWLSQKLGKPVAKTEPIVHALKDWVDAQYEGGRVTNIGDGELWDVYQMQMEA